mmetsp:Transcript_44173/g.96095  ORF Transcript_44173/g.96095 Transcript_44173/m.96095 type:complete len:116 (+) Transcript_44173:136-483(+)
MVGGVLSGLAGCAIFIGGGFGTFLSSMVVTLYCVNIPSGLLKVLQEFGSPLGCRAAKGSGSFGFVFSRRRGWWYSLECPHRRHTVLLDSQDGSKKWRQSHAPPSAKKRQRSGRSS